MHRPPPLLVLAVLCAAQFMVVLDVTVVNVALPEVGADLGLGATAVRWTVTAYTLAFGALLLLGGRAADVLGRRRVFVAGLLVFTGASLAAGLAQDAAGLLAARAVQGAGAALLAPAALSLIAVAFPAGPERHRAFAAWAAIGAGGAALGVLLGGLLTEALGWRSVFLVNVPVGVAGAALAGRLLPAGRPVARPAADAPGALLAGAGVLALVYALVEADTAGWTSAQTLGLVAAAAVALTAFGWWEGRTAQPLVPPGVLARRTTATALGLMLVAAGTLVSAFFLLSLHLQQQLGHSALRTGLEFLPAALAVLVAAHLGARAVGRHGARPVIAAGLTTAAAGAALLAGLDAGDGYAAGVLPGFVLLAGGLGFAFVAITTTAMAGAGPADAGVVSALTTTAHELGAALLLAVLSGVAVAGAAGGAPLGAGAGDAFAVAAAITGVGALAALALLRRTDVAPGHAPAFAH